MAPRKKRTFILERDHAFTKTIGSVNRDKPDPLSLAVAEAQLHIDTEYGQPAPYATQPSKVEAVREQAAAAEMLTAPIITETAQPNTPAPQPVVEDAPVAKIERAGDKVTEADKPEGGATSEAAPEAQQGDGTPPAAEAQPKAAGVGDAASPVELNVSIFVPGDLVERAEKWGAAIHQPLKAVMRHSFTKLRPELLAELKSITAGDVHQDRGERIGYRLQSRMRFTPAEIADMEARLDPAGFGNLNSILNYYARNRFTAFLDELMANAGY